LRTLVTAEVGTGYRGPDRRVPVEHGLTAIRTALVAGGILTFLVAAGVAATTSWAVSSDRITGTSAAVLLDAAAVAAAAHLGAAGCTYLRATGEAIGARVAGIGGLALLATTAGLLATTPAVGAARTAALLLAALWALAAVRGPTVEAGRRVVADGAATIAILVVVIVAGGRPSLPAAALDVASVTIIAAWLTVAASWLRAALHGADPLPAWLTWAAVAIAGAELLALVGPDTDAFPTASGLRLGGLFAAGVGVGVVLASHVAARRAQTLQVRAEFAATQRADVEARREREHEVGNALFVAEGAAVTLARSIGALDETTRAELATTVHDGIVRFRELYERTTSREPQSAVLGDVVEERAALARARGVAVTVDGHRDVRVRIEGSTLGQVLDNLLLNAVHHAGAGTDDPVAVHVGVESGRGVVRVSDRGPGIPSEAREAVFGRGVQLDPATPGQGLGLYVSRRLLREAGGDLLVDGAARGACFLLVLPLDPRRSGEVSRG
jgi:signal transduction histidine kinase